MSRPLSVRARRTPSLTGFTLVELLVVIGIIALLISMLLPGLNRARKAATVVDCQSRLRTVSQAMSLYAASYHGFLPPAIGWYPHDNTLRIKYAANLLSEQLGTPEWETNKAFSDSDTIDPGEFASDGNPYSLHSATQGGVVCHYSPNARLIPVTANPADGSLAVIESFENFPKTKLQTGFRCIGRVKDPQATAIWWDAAQNTGFGAQTPGTSANAAWYTSDGTDNWGWFNPNNHFVSRDNPEPGYQPARPVITTNKDTPDGTADSHGGIRFRHMNNTVANLLFADGHVESRRFNKTKGQPEMTVRELGSNFVPPLRLP